MKPIISILGLSAAFAVLDMIWWGYLGMSHLFQQQLGEQMGNIRYGSALAVYLLLGWGTYHWVLIAHPEAHWRMIVLEGALLGLYAYGIFEGTNYAILKNWSWHLVVIDILWGMMSVATIAGFTRYLKIL